MNTTITLAEGNSGDRKIPVWIVLEELPETKDGYKVVMEEDTREFGLAWTGTDGEPFYGGPYGDFLTTLEAM